MSLTITAFLIAALSLFVSILSFMLGSEKYKAWRYAAGVSLLFLTAVFTWMGIFSFLSATQIPNVQQIIVNDPAVATPTAAPVSVHTPSNEEGASATIEPESAKQTPTPISEATGCAIGTPLPHRQPIVGEPWILPNGGWIIVNFWSNEPGIDQTEHKILLEPDDPRAFLGGGSAWQWPNDCESVARQNLRDNPLPPITLEELKIQNLVR